MVSIRKRHDGRYEARIRYQGRRFSVCGRTEDEVRRKLAELERRLVLDQPPPPGRLTIGQLVERWLETEQRRWKPRTLANYRNLYRRHVEPELGRVPLAKLAPDRLQRFLDRLPGERTPSHVYRLLHRCFRWAEAMGWLSTNPCDRVRPPGYTPRRPVLPDLDAVRRLVQHCLDSADTGAPLVGFLLVTGCRLCEALALRWSDVDWSTGTVRIERSGQHVAGAWVESAPKTAAGRRVVAIGPTGLAFLRKQRTLVAERRLRAGPTWRDLDLVFCGTHGQPLQQRTVVSALDRICREAGVPRLTPHGLRHLHASLLLSAGVSITDVSQRLGHASSAITLQVYSHALSDGRAAAERFERLLGG